MTFSLISILRRDNTVNFQHATSNTFKMASKMNWKKAIFLLWFCDIIFWPFYRASFVQKSTITYQFIYVFTSSIYKYKNIVIITDTLGRLRYEPSKQSFASFFSFGVTLSYRIWCHQYSYLSTLYYNIIDINRKHNASCNKCPNFIKNSSKEDMWVCLQPYIMVSHFSPVSNAIIFVDKKYTN